VRNGGLRQIEWRVNVGTERLVPLLRGYFGNRRVSPLEGSVVDEDIDPAELRYRPLHQVDTVLFRLYVTSNDNSTLACLLDPFCCSRASSSSFK